MPDVLILTTGGTIASRTDAPLVDGNTLVGAVPEVLEYADVRVGTERVGCAVVTALGGDPPPMSDPNRIKVNLRLCSSAHYKDVATLWLGLPYDILERADMLKVCYRSSRKTVMLHVVRCVCDA